MIVGASDLNALGRTILRETRTLPGVLDAITCPAVDLNGSGTAQIVSHTAFLPLGRRAVYFAIEYMQKHLSAGAPQRIDEGMRKIM
jgi:hypothetical protein